MTNVLWVGNEAESYILSTGNHFEEAAANDPGYGRTGMRVARSDPGVLVSTPDWAATDEIWHRFNYFVGGGYSNGFNIWTARNAAGTDLARITCAGGAAQFQIWNGAAFVNVGAAFAFVGLATKGRFDIHVKGGAAGVIDVYHGAPGSQIKVVEAAGNYASVTGLVRVTHAGTQTAGGFNSDIGHEIVQDTPTLSTNCEIKPPTSDGTDVDGGAGEWADQDEAPYSDADATVLDTTGKRQSFKAAARTLTQATVVGVTVSVRAWYEAGGGPTKIKPYLKISGVRYYGPTFTLDLVAKGYQYTWALNPATGALFTAAQANDATLEWGWEAVA